VRGGILQTACSHAAPSSRYRKQGLKDGMKFKAELLDTWNMTVTRAEQTFTMKALSSYMFGAGASIRLPGKPWMAIRIRRIK
jgi:hypothetical protein